MKKQLEDRLQQKGYTLIDKERSGRKVFYTLEENNTDKEVYNNIIKYVYNTNKELEFTKYFTLRTNAEDQIISKADISNCAEVSCRTISNWDNKLMNLNIIAKDGYYYFCIDKDNKTIKQCTVEEYKNFWKNTLYIKAFKDLQIKYVAGEIDLNQLTLASAEIGATIALVNSKYYYRIKKYKTNLENKLYIDTNNLIKSIYKENIEEFKFLNNVQLEAQNIDNSR